MFLLNLCQILIIMMIKLTLEFRKKKRSQIKKAVVSPKSSQNFSDLENAVDLDNFYPLPERKHSKFEYCNASKTFSVEREIV